MNKAKKATESYMDEDNIINDTFDNDDCMDDDDDEAALESMLFEMEIDLMD